MIAAASNCAPGSPTGHGAASWWASRCGGRSWPVTARMPTNSPAAHSPIWGAHRRSMTVWCRSKRCERADVRGKVSIADAGGGDIAIVGGADAVLRAHRGVGRTQAGQPGQGRLDVHRPPVEVAAAGAGWGTRTTHWPRRLQNSLNTCVESTKPRTPLTEIGR